MADYVVSGAGASAYNDDYTDNGSTANGQPVYESSGGGEYLYYTHDDLMPGYIWVLNSTLGPDLRATDVDYRLNTWDETDPTAGVWVAENGASPAPYVFEDASWYNASWSYRQPINIDPSNVAGDETNFPVIITEDNVQSEFWTNVASDGSDIVITSDDGTTKLKRELVAGSWDIMAHGMELWVKIPSLSSSTPTTFYVYYGNASASETNDTDVWDANYEAVFHLSEDPSPNARWTVSGSGTAACDGDYIAYTTNDGKPAYENTNGKKLYWGSTGSKWYISGTLGTAVSDYRQDSGGAWPDDDTWVVDDTGDSPAPTVSEDVDHGGQILDSTDQNHDGTPYGIMSSADLAAGLFGKCLEMDGSDDYVDVGSMLDVVGDETFTIELLADPTASSSPTVSKYNRTGDKRSYLGYVNASSVWKCYLSDNGSSDVISQDVSNVVSDGWHHLAMVYDNDHLYCYVDGAEGQDTDASLTGNTYSSDEPTTIGRAGWTLSDYKYLTGKIDEVRLSVNARSANWISTSSTMQQDVTGFSTASAEEVNSGGEDTNDIGGIVTVLQQGTDDLGGSLTVLQQGTDDLGGSLTVLQQGTNDLGVSIIVYNYTPNTSPRPGNTRTNLSPSSNANMDFNGSPKSHPSNSQSPFNG